MGNGQNTTLGLIIGAIAVISFIVGIVIWVRADMMACSLLS